MSAFKNRIFTALFLLTENEHLVTVTEKVEVSHWNVSPTDRSDGLCG